jgi:TP901 family phage tail tape measure protein
MKLLPGVTNLATVANVDLATATDIASDSLGAFGLMTDNSAKLAKNFTRVQDVMAKTTATSNTNLTDLFEAVKKGAPDFTAAGQSIETFSTLIGTMANAGIKGAEAGTKLRNISTRLAKPTKEAAAAMEMLGIRVEKEGGGFRDMLDILDDVRKGTSKLGEVQKSAALATIFGVRQTGGLNVILKEGTERLRSYRQMLIDSKGASEKMATVMRSSLINRLKSLGSALTEVGFQFFSAFDEQGASAIDKLTQFVRKIDLTPLINGIKTLFGFGKKLFDKFVEIGQRTGVFDNIQKSAEKLKPIFNTVKDIISTIWGFLERTGVLDLVAKSFGVLLKVIGPLGKIFTAMWGIVKPILLAFEKILTPIVTGLTFLLEKQGEMLDVLGAKGPTEEKKQENIAIAKKSLARETAAITKYTDPRLASFLTAAQEKRSPAAMKPLGQELNFNASLNINNAPKGSKVEQDSDLMKIKMSEMAPAPTG